MCQEDVDGESGAPDLCVLGVVDVWKSDAPRGERGPDAVRSFCRSENCACSRCLVTMHQAGCAVKGDFEALIDGGAQECRDREKGDL